MPTARKPIQKERAVQSHMTTPHAKTRAKRPGLRRAPSPDMNDSSSARPRCANLGAIRPITAFQSLTTIVGESAMVTSANRAPTATTPANIAARLIGCPPMVVPSGKFENNIAITSSSTTMTASKMRSTASDAKAAAKLTRESSFVIA